MKKIKLSDIVNSLRQDNFLIEDLSLGNTKYMGICKLNNKSISRRIDIRYFNRKESYGAALLYFTGSKKFNKSTRQKAINLGLKLNEYGLFRHEKDIFKEQYLKSKKIKKLLGFKLTKLLNREWDKLSIKEKRKYINKSKKTKLKINTERGILKRLKVNYVKPIDRNL